MSVDPDRIPESFPAPSFRGMQAEAVNDIRDSFDAGNNVVLVRAPTGSGKSLLARAIAGSARRAADAEPSDAINAYYTTPQVSQLDDVAADPLLDDLNIIRGKSNYTCILNGETETPVNRAPCAREQGYDCSVQHRCPYFSDRAIASNRRIAAMTLAYFMQTAGSNVFGRRDVVVIDEAHGLAEWAEMYATVNLQANTVPIWDELTVPDLTAESDPVDRTIRFAETLTDACERSIEPLTNRDELTPGEAARRDRLQEIRSELRWFITDARDPHSTTTWVIDQNYDDDSNNNEIAIKPLDPARYLSHTVWDRGNQFALLSATILNKKSFCRGVGLDPAEVALVDVDHTFPVANRPLYDVTCGKMTYDERDETLPAVTRMLVRLMAAHPDEKGLIHCHSYAIQSSLRRRLAELGVESRIRTHDNTNRDESLQAWLNTDSPDVFLSVTMEEALDLQGELCRWQVICKAPYLNTTDSRVSRRLSDGKWSWYRRVALRTVIQACGRIVRAPDDHGSTYLADSSLLKLFNNTQNDMPAWFRDQVDRLSTPTLPSFEEATTTVGRASTTESQSSSTPRSNDYSDKSNSNHDTDSESHRSTHPLSDVWGEE
ncbi:MAG: Rad3-related DNA helicase [Haloquadratum walsbyi J07HQW2]|uniref:Rad3-related DNA helicase n=1 Tax=Haloquadratum walsbyi J07HQW2 TaxID=1238425 RepID=U1NFQ5_9EURY|nr:MAG: Rad3-related DNA helicase [Haloquadratum walsbyi J07HQW2]